MRDFLCAVALAVLAVAFGPSAHALQPVLQRGYDANVSGANLAEVTLNTSNVAVSTFGLVFKLPVDDNDLCPAAVRTECRHRRPGNPQRGVRRDHERFALRLRRR